MHELALSGAIVETAVQHAAGRPVRRVDLTIGTLRQVVPDTLAFYFEIVARGTLCEGAKLVPTIVPTRVRCPACDSEWEAETPTFRCECGSPGEIVAGNEFLIESIVVSEEDECSPARS